MEMGCMMCDMEGMFHTFGEFFEKSGGTDAPICGTF
jgi:hypothetical protein